MCTFLSFKHKVIEQAKKSVVVTGMLSYILSSSMVFCFSNELLDLFTADFFFVHILVTFPDDLQLFFTSSKPCIFVLFASIICGLFSPFAFLFL